VNKPTMNQVLAGMAYAAGVISTASAEVALAQACGFGAVSWCLPVALDVYVLVALRRRLDVGLAVGVLLVIVSTSHLVTSSFLEVNAWVVIGVSSVAPLILWRVHGLLWGHQEEIQAIQEDDGSLLDPLQGDLETPGEFLEPQVSALENLEVPVIAEPPSEVVKDVIPEPLQAPLQAPLQEVSSPAPLLEHLQEIPSSEPMDVETLVEKLLASGPDLPGRSRVMSAYGVSEHTAKRALQEVRRVLETELVNSSPATAH
jgi:hypothetical protein